MLPHHEDAARVLDAHRRAETERIARDHGHIHERRAVGNDQAARSVRSVGPSEADCRPCPPPCPEHARGMAG
jgi:hypothetical protein